MMAPHNPAEHQYPTSRLQRLQARPAPRPPSTFGGPRAKFYNGLRGATSNISVYILEENMRPVPIGEPGVMEGGGVGLIRIEGTSLCSAYFESALDSSWAPSSMTILATCNDHIRRHSGSPWND
ncbi:hypothetical protein CC2G_006942 [Coprinopsis cinerea AmutBmut pab1-1]|nr:hypothetical protein CC2G_006942 [Coprinopsis cinerea AmutBmut pab1-1]